MMILSARRPAAITLALLAALGMAGGCQSPKTRGGSTEAAVVDPKTEAARVLALEPVILDARSPLDYGVSHVPGAINVVWSDFGRPGARDAGVLDADHFGLARRLALWGIAPEKPVLVVGGAGERDQGEAGRVAWMLRYLGVGEVYVGSESVYRGTIPRGATRPRNETSWIPSVRAELEISVADFLAKASAPRRSGITTRARAKALGGLVVPEPPTQDRVILDVRDDAENLEIPTQHLKIKLVRVPWRRFFLADGRPLPEAGRLLTEAGVGEGVELLVISEEGVKSAAATYALERAGRTRLGNVSAGWGAVRRALAPTAVPAPAGRR